MPQESGCRRNRGTAMMRPVNTGIEMVGSSGDYARIERAIAFLAANFREQPTLSEVARHVGLSEFHFQRLFRRWAGISPKRFVQYLTARHAAGLLRAAGGVLGAAHDAGLSGGGRLHDLFVNVHAMTPGEWKAEGSGVRIEYGFHPSPFGECLVGATGRGVCWLAFVAPGTRRRALAELADAWPNAALRTAAARTHALADRIFGNRRNGQALDLLVKGTNFQIRVWEALLALPPGVVTTYEAIAARLGTPRSTRAVANAVARNPVAFLIPCHRVIRKTGALGGYHWGTSRKRAILAWEVARSGSWDSETTGPPQP